MGHAAIQPRAGRLPFPCHGRTRYREHGRDLLFRQTPEVTQFDDLGLTRVKACQLTQSLIDQQQLTFAGLNGGQSVVKGDFKGWRRPLRGVTGPCVVDEDAAHHLRRDSEEVRPILPPDTLLTEEPEIGFMDQCRRLERVVRALAAKVRGRSASKFAINERQQLIARLKIAPPPGLQQSTHVDRSGLGASWRSAVARRAGHEWFGAGGEGQSKLPAQACPTCSTLRCSK